jgi:hypothetical protein
VGLAESYAPDAPLFALALGDVEALHRYFAELRNVRLEVTGADLAELGLDESPRVGEILAELKRQKLDGRLDGRESELSAARELIGSADGQSPARSTGGQSPPVHQMRQMPETPPEAGDPGELIGSLDAE